MLRQLQQIGDVRRNLCNRFPLFLQRFQLRKERLCLLLVTPEVRVLRFLLELL
jgi:hypothetical protein